MVLVRTAAIVVTLLMIVFVDLAAAHRERADLSRLVVIGDSLSAGYQNGSLLDPQQVKGYASLVAQQAHTALPLPLIAEPGIPNVLTLVDPGPPPVIAPAPGASPGRSDPTTQAMNLAVPGHAVADALGTRPGCTFAPDPATIMTDLVLGLPGCFGPVVMSQVEWAEALAPTTILVWIGNMDALRAAIVADPIALTPMAAFDADYTDLLARLAATGATLVVANIPDVTVIPFLTSAETVAQIVGLPLALIGPTLGLAAGDFVTPDAFALIPAILSDATLGPLPGGVVLTATEVAVIRESIAQFNAIIAREARHHGASQVDVHRLLDRIQAEGRRPDADDGVPGRPLLTRRRAPDGYWLRRDRQRVPRGTRRRLPFADPSGGRGRVAASDPLVPPSSAREGVALADHVHAEEAHAVRAAWRAR